MSLNQILNGVFLSSLFASAIRLAVPLLLAALGELFSERAGILNIGIEGIMLVGALGGFLGAYYFGNPWIGLIFGMIAGLLASSIHALLCVTFATDQVVSGIAVNVLSLGLSVFIYRTIFGIPVIVPQAVGFSTFQVPLLSSIPIIGVILFKHHALVYISFFLACVAYVVIFKSIFGLKLTAVGEDPHACSSLGISVKNYRYLGVLIGGVFSGMAGTFIVLTSARTFQETMIAGRGYIAIAVVMFGKWNPLSILLASLVFGLADAFQLYLQAFSITTIPPQLLQSLPYLITIIFIVSAGGKSLIPSSLCVPYKKEA